MQRNAPSLARERMSGRTLAAVGRRAAILALIWLALTRGEATLLGAAALPAACWLSLRLLPPHRPLRLLPLVATAPAFVWRSLLGGIDVARRALDPRLPLNPGWIEVAVDLPDGGRVALGGQLSLMPGTLAAGSEGGRLLVHVLDRDQDVEGAVRIEEVRLGRAAGLRAAGLRARGLG
jgi:multicomponent Na+:H+ antiporter subunit E